MTRFIVEKDKIISNIAVVKEKAANRVIYAVLKSNAYGMGLDWMADTLSKYGIRHFAVTEAGSALRLRARSLDAEILLLNPVSSADELRLLIGPASPSPYRLRDRRIL